jgi:transposase
MAAGWRCAVAASSKLHRRAGDRVKTDARDALRLARLLRLDEIVSVRIPTRPKRPRVIWSAPVRRPDRI